MDRCDSSRDMVAPRGLTVLINAGKFNKSCKCIISNSRRSFILKKGAGGGDVVDFMTLTGHC